MSKIGPLPDTCTIETPTITAGDIKQPKRTWKALYSNIKCRIAALSATEREIAGRLGMNTTHRCFVDAEYTGIAAKMRLTDGDELVYDITGVQPYKDATALHHFEILMERLT